MRGGAEICIRVLLSLSKNVNELNIVKLILSIQIQHHKIKIFRVKRINLKIRNQHYSVWCLDLVGIVNIDHFPKISLITNEMKNTIPAINTNAWTLLKTLSNGEILRIFEP